MDASYYFVLETDGVDDGPYRLTEIQRRIHIGLISKQASLVKCGETNYVPLTDARYAHLLEAPPEPEKPTAGVSPPVAAPVVASPEPVVTKPEPVAEPKPTIEVVVKPEPGRAAAGTIPPPERPVASTLMITPSPIAAVSPMPAAEPRPAAAMQAPPSQTFMAPPPVPPRAAPPPIPAKSSPGIAPPPPPTPASTAPTAFAPAMSSPAIAPSAPPTPTTAPAVFPTMPPPGITPMQQMVGTPAKSPPAIAPPVPAAAASTVAATTMGHEPFPRVAPTVAVTPDASFSMPSMPEPSPFPRVSPTVAIETAPVPEVAKAPSARALIAKAKAKADKPAAHGPLATAQTAFIAPQPAQPAPITPLAHAPTAMSMSITPDVPLTLQPPAVAVMPRGFVPPRPVEEALHGEPFPIDAEGSAPLTMPTVAAGPLAEPLGGPVAHHGSLALPAMPHQPLALPPPGMPPYQQPLPQAPAAPRFAPGWWKSKKVLAIGGGGLAAFVVILALAIGLRGGGGTSVPDAMVRVSTPSGTGAGFFIAGPDQYAYVATANHVVDRGERILVERDVGTGKSAFVEAYPETEIVAADADADLAIIRIKNVDASRFPQLSLAKEPLKDEHILSYGYPGSSLATKTGLVNKDGKILSLVSFPAYDERYQRVLRDNAVDGLLISTDIEPGMSGGPTTNDAGDVVGINVTKDRAHTGQNGAVSVVALRTLVGTIKPAAEHAAPTTDEVAKLLERIQSEYLLLPLDERKKVRETDFVSAGDLPQLRQLVNEVRREERNTDTSFIAKYRLSGQAALGIFFARMPGKLLETYRAPSTIAPIVSCELANQRLTSFLGDLSSADKRIETPKNSVSTCDELAVRPLAWDLVAATLQWEGKEQKYSVAKLDKMDEDGKVFRAQVRISGTSNLIELWIGMDRGQPRLKVFDPTSSLYAIKSPRNVAASSLQGTWSIKRPRVTDAINKEAEVESSETLSISVDDGKVSIRHVVTERYFGAGNRARVFTCNGRKAIETGLLQSFTGTLENGVVVGFPDKEAEAVGLDAGYCRPAHKSDRIVAVKLAGDQLYLYRTDGNAYPDAVQLTRDTAMTVP